MLQTKRGALVLIFIYWLQSKHATLYVLNRDTFILSPVRIIRNRIKLSFLPAKLPDPANYVATSLTAARVEVQSRRFFFGCMRAASERFGSDGVGDFAPKKTEARSRSNTAIE